MSRLLKANTVKSRVHSLYRQGQTYLQLLPSMPEIQSKSSSAVSRITASARQNLKTSRPTVANVRRENLGIGQRRAQRFWLADHVAERAPWESSSGEVFTRCRPTHHSRHPLLLSNVILDDSPTLSNHNT